MLSGKLKNWVESHLNRKKSGRNKTGGGERNKHHDSIGSTMCNGADRIAHPASSLVSLTMPSVPTMMVCSSGGSAALGSGAMGSHSHGGGSVSGRRSNAALLIQLQKDIANSSSAACSATSSCYNTPSRSTAGGVHHPSWSRSPVMLAWNNSSAATTTTSSSSPVPRTPARPLLSSPFPLQHHPTPSPPPPLQYQQSNYCCEPSPSCSAASDWTTKSFTGESGCGSAGGGGGSISSKATVTSDRERSNGDSCSRRRLKMMMTGAPSLSSPESAYSTGCSADGVSPTSQDGHGPPETSTLTPPTPTTPTAPPLLPLLQVDTSTASIWRRSLLSSDGLDGQQQPSPMRARPTIRTNPWLPVRWSSSSAASSTWMNQPEATTQSRLLDDFFADESSASSPPPPPAPSCPNDVVTIGKSSRHFDVVMDGDELRVIAQYQKTLQQGPGKSFSSGGGGGVASWADTDDRYNQLIRETEEMLQQLEKDELLLGSRAAEESVKAKANKMVVAPPSTATTAPVIPHRRRKKKLSTASRRSASRATSQCQLMSSRSSSRSSSSDSESTADDVSTWSSSRRRRPRPRPFSSQRQRQRQSSSTTRFLVEQNAGRVPHHPPLASTQWNLPDEWPERDRPPSPAPLDPHCNNGHGRQATPVVGRRSYYHHQKKLLVCSSSSSGSSGTSLQQLKREEEQERLESQIARLCQQLKDATDDYYFYDRRRLTPSSSDFSL